MFFKPKTTRPVGARCLVASLAALLLASGLGSAAVVPPTTDGNRAFPHPALEGLRIWPPATATQEQIFVNEAGQLNLLETRLGELALQKSNRPAVQNYARRMIADHQRLNGELAAVARTSRFTVPTHLDVADLDAAARLATLRGGAFDRAYLRASVSDHEAGIAAFQNIAAGTPTSGLPPAPVVDWARQRLPWLNDQLALGQITARNLEEETAAGM